MFFVKNPDLLKRLIIVDFKLFGCEEMHSEYQPLEVTRHTPLTDRMALHYFELPKLPKEVDTDSELQLWLALFNAETEEELTQLERLEVPVLKQAIGAYRSITATEEFKTLERMRSDARHNEASALGHARREEAKKWQGVVAEKDARIAELDGRIAELETLLKKNAF
jgi:hypothetical protein